MLLFFPETGVSPPKAPNVLDQQDPSQLQPQKLRFAWQIPRDKPARVVKQNEKGIEMSLNLFRSSSIFASTTCLEIQISSLDVHHQLITSAKAPLFAHQSPSEFVWEIPLLHNRSKFFVP